jgi:hypothetical protein
MREGKFRREMEFLLEFLQDASSERFEEVFSGLNELEVMEWDYRLEELLYLSHQEFVPFSD